MFSIHSGNVSDNLPLGLIVPFKILTNGFAFAPPNIEPVLVSILLIEYGILSDGFAPNISIPILFGSIMAGWDFSIIALGILFKLMFFPGADNMLVTGIILLTILQIGSLFIRKTNPETFARFFNRVIIFFGAGLLASFLSYNQIIDFEYSDDVEYSEALKKTMTYPNDTAIRKEFDALRLERAKDLP